MTELRTAPIGMQERRRALRMTQNEMADRLGVTQGSLAAWEKGLAYPSIDRLPDIAKEYGCDVEQLVQALIGARKERSGGGGHEAEDMRR